MSASLEIHHKFEVRFTFPMKVAESIEQECTEIADGLTEILALGKWLDGSGNLIKDDMYLCIVTVNDEMKIYRLKQKVGQILTEYGEASMWFVYNPIQGGVFDLRNEEKVDVDYQLEELLESYAGTSDCE